MTLPQVFQFFVGTTVVGSFLTFLFQVFRDRASRSETLQTAKRELIKQVDELYRSSKQIKRMLRARIEGNDEFMIKAAFFSDRMDELSKTQLSLETCRQIIRTRWDLFLPDQQKRILFEIGYAESYIHDVVEEFEKRRVNLCDAVCKITKECTMINDFVGPRWLPATIVGDFKIMEDGETPEERYAALRRVLAVPLTNFTETEIINRRYKSIADECLRMALNEMRVSLMQSRMAEICVGKWRALKANIEEYYAIVKTRAMRSQVARRQG
jgi:hypothetical protein